MKKLAFISATIASLLAPAQVLAVDIVVNPPGIGYPTLGDAISKILILAFMVALIIVLVMLIVGAYEWITSGGDKEAVGKARNRIINALVGLAVLAIAFALFRFAGQFLGFGGVSDTGDIRLNIPTPAK